MLMPTSTCVSGQAISSTLDMRYPDEVSFRLRRLFLRIPRLVDAFITNVLDRTLGKCLQVHRSNDNFQFRVAQ
jgi:hypothetical protein